MSKMDDLYQAEMKKGKKRNRNTLIATALVGGGAAYIGINNLKTRQKTKDRMKELNLSLIPVADQSTRWISEKYDYWDAWDKRNKAYNVSEDDWETAYRKDAEKTLKAHYNRDKDADYNQDRFDKRLNEYVEAGLPLERQKMELYADLRGVPRDLTKEKAITKYSAPVARSIKTIQDRVSSKTNLGTVFLENQGIVPSTNLESVDSGIEYSGKKVYLKLPEGYADYNDRKVFLEGIATRTRKLAEARKIDEQVFALSNIIGSFKDVKKGMSTETKGDQSFLNIILNAMGTAAGTAQNVSATNSPLNAKPTGKSGYFVLGNNSYSYRELENKFWASEFKNNPELIKNNPDGFEPFIQRWRQQVINVAEKLRETDFKDNWDVENDAPYRTIANADYIIAATKKLLELHAANPLDLDDRDIELGTIVDNSDPSNAHQIIAEHIAENKGVVDFTSQTKDFDIYNPKDIISFTSPINGNTRNVELGNLFTYMLKTLKDDSDNINEPSDVNKRLVEIENIKQSNPELFNTYTGFNNIVNAAVENFKKENKILFTSSKDTQTDTKTDSLFNLTEAERIANQSSTDVDAVDVNIFDIADNETKEKFMPSELKNYNTQIKIAKNLSDNLNNENWKANKNPSTIKNTRKQLKETELIIKNIIDEAGTSVFFDPILAAKSMFTPEDERLERTTIPNLKKRLENTDLSQALRLRLEKQLEDAELKLINIRS
jgi:hypothetical protein